MGTAEKKKPRFSHGKWFSERCYSKTSWNINLELLSMGWLQLVSLQSIILLYQTIQVEQVRGVGRCDLPACRKVTIQQWESPAGLFMGLSRDTHLRTFWNWIVAKEQTQSKRQASTWKQEWNKALYPTWWMGHEGCGSLCFSAAREGKAEEASRWHWRKSYAPCTGFTCSRRILIQAHRDSFQFLFSLF